MGDRMGIPESLRHRQILHIDVLYKALVILFVDYVKNSLHSNTQLVFEFQLSDSQLQPPKINICYSFNAAHPLQLSNPNSPRMSSIAGSTSFQLSSPMLQISTKSLFLPSLSTPPNFIRYSLPREQSVEFIVGYLHDAMNLHSLVLELKTQHCFGITSSSSIPPTMQIILFTHTIDWLDLPT